MEWFNKIFPDGLSVHQLAFRFIFIIVIGMASLVGIILGLFAIFGPHWGPIIGVALTFIGGGYGFAWGFRSDMKELGRGNKPLDAVLADSWCDSMNRQYRHLFHWKEVV